MRICTAHARIHFITASHASNHVSNAAAERIAGSTRSCRHHYSMLGSAAWLMTCWAQRSLTLPAASIWFIEHADLSIAGLWNLLSRNRAILRELLIGTERSKMNVSSTKAPSALRPRQAWVRAKTRLKPHCTCKTVLRENARRTTGPKSASVRWQICVQPIPIDVRTQSMRPAKVSE